MSTAAESPPDKQDKKTIVEISDLKTHDTLISDGGRLIVMYHATWAQPSVFMRRIYEKLLEQHLERVEKQPNAHHVVHFGIVMADKGGENIIKAHNIKSVPYFGFYHNGKLCRSIEGAKNEDLIKGIEWMDEASDDMLVTGVCQTIINRSDIMVLIKGSAHSPKCSFCKRLMELLRRSGVVFDTFDVLSDNSAVKERMKEVAQWETYPMLFAHGKLVGGIDKVEKLHDERRLISELSGERTSKRDDDVAYEPSRNAAAAAEKQRGEGDVQQIMTENKIKELIHEHDVMLFMKGTADEPRCGFSRKMVETLRSNSVGAFDTFDILSDQALRQRLKEYSKWPTYPQLYVKGTFVGGLDIVKEMAAMGDLAAQLGV